MFRKIMGDPPVGQIAFTFSMIGLMNAALLWPICLALYFSGTEQMPSETIPWAILMMACVLMLGKCLYDVFHLKCSSFHPNFFDGN
jgi:solute carrier family 35, member F3/4